MPVIPRFQPSNLRRRGAVERRAGRRGRGGNSQRYRRRGIVALAEDLDAGETAVLLHALDEGLRGRLRRRREQLLAQELVLDVVVEARRAFDAYQQLA